MPLISKSKRREWERKLLPKFGGPVIAAMIRSIAMTQRLRFEGREHMDAALASGRPLLFAFWHEDIISIAMAHLRIKTGPIAVMVSRSRDGDLLARCCELLGLNPVRASSSRGGAAGLVIMKRFLEQTNAKGHATLALDGPTGPRRIAKPGMALLGRLTQGLIVPIGFRHGFEYRFNSWDRHRLPLWFSRTTVFIGKPFDCATWDENDEANAAKITEVMAELARLGDLKD